MSAQQLADKTADVGMPIPRSVLANLESGRRETVSVAELLVLAWALGVAPIALLCPVGHSEVLEVLPGQPLATEVALEWITGEGTLLPAGRTLVMGPAPEPSASNVTLYRAYSNAERDWINTTEKIRQLVDQSNRGEAELYIDRLASIEENLRSYRALMSARGLLRPHLPAGLERLDRGEEAPAEDREGR